MPDPITEQQPSITPSASVAPAPTATPTPAAEPKEVSIRESLEAGFKKEAAPEQAAPTPPEAPAEVKPPEVKAEATPEQQAAEQTELVRQGRMPRNWKGGLDKWHTLEPTTKDYILRREKEFAQGINMYREQANVGVSLMNEFA